MASKKNDTEQKTLSIFHQVKGRKWKEEEILFLNRCRHTERMDRQIHQALFLEGRREICEFGTAMWVLLAFFLLVNQVWVFGALSAVLAVIYPMGVYYWLPKMMSKKYFSWLCRELDTNCPTTKLYVGEEYLEYEFLETGGKMLIKYSQVEEWVEYEEAMVITVSLPESQEYFSMLVEKEGFVKGSYAKFVQFLEQKCTRVRDEQRRMVKRERTCKICVRLAIATLVLTLLLSMLVVIWAVAIGIPVMALLIAYGYGAKKDKRLQYMIGALFFILLAVGVIGFFLTSQA